MRFLCFNEDKECLFRFDNWRFDSNKLNGHVYKFYFNPPVQSWGYSDGENICNVYLIDFKIYIERIDWDSHIVTLIMEESPLVNEILTHYHQEKNFDCYENQLLFFRTHYMKEIQTRTEKYFKGLNK